MFIPLLCAAVFAVFAGGYAVGYAAFLWKNGMRGAAVGAVLPIVLAAALGVAVFSL